MGSPSSFPPQSNYMGQPGYTPPPSWWSRNWKWMVPVGCFTALVIVALFVGFVTSIVFGIFGMIKSSGAYEQALARAKESVEVHQALGQPIEEAWYVTGNVNMNGSSGNANLAIPLSGPKGDATLYVEATKRADQWNFHVLRLHVKRTGENIDLLASGTI